MAPRTPTHSTTSSPRGSWIRSSACRRRQRDAVRFRVRDAHLAQSRQAARLWPCAVRNFRRGARPERAVRGRLHRLRTARHRTGPLGHGHRGRAFHFSQAVRDVILRTNTDGTTVRLKDVARVELGAFQYGRDVQLNDVPVAGIAVQLLPNANASRSPRRSKRA